MEPQRVSKQGETVWIIDPKHTTVEFSIRNLFFFTVTGRFSDVTAVLASSIDTGNKRRDDHVRSKDFFDAKRYPRILFESASVERGTDRDTLRIAGTLTIKGQSREVVLNVTEVDHSHSPHGEEVAYFGAMIELDRFDFGINYGRGWIGRKVKISVYVQAVRRS
jgi:polyisoprenoid-binding protein YceI